MTETKDAAHAYAARGWRPVALHGLGPDGETCSCSSGRLCRDKGKHPIEKGWQTREPLSGADIEELWGRYPRANVGLATGHDFWVLDIDPDNGGGESWAQLRAEHGSVEATHAVRTGSGGWHLYFALPDFVPGNSAGRLPKGIDVRGLGGQVVAPPSHTDKGGYTVHEGPLLEAPDWLVDLVRPAVPSAVVGLQQAPKVEDIEPAEQGRLDRYVESVRKAEIAELAKCSELGWDGPHWNQTTYNVACTLVELGNSPWATYTVAQAYADVFEKAPRDAGFTDATVNIAFESATKKTAGKIRPMPPRPLDISDFETGEDDFTASLKAEPVSPPEPENPKTKVSWDQNAFFDRVDGLKTDVLAAAVTTEAKIAWGADQQTWQYLDGVWKPAPRIIQRTVASIIPRRYRMSHAANVASFLEPNLPEISCRPVPEVMNFRNGLLDWTTGTMLPHSSEIMSTVQFPYEWNADATCPRFEAFLEEVLSEDYIALVWEMLGYLMYSGNPMQTAFLFLGSGQNGKGTLMRVTQSLLGMANISTQSLDSLNTNRFSAVNLFGKIANIAGDIDATYQESTANFKKLTGEDSYDGERKYGNSFTFESWAVPIFSANKIPGSADTSEGYLRRWIILEFLRKFSEKERTMGLSDVLVSELPGIATKAVAALRVLMDRGYFDIQGDAKAGKERFATTIDQIRQWVDDATIAAEDHNEPRDNLYIAYKNWAHRNGAGQIKAMEFYDRLANLGFEQKKVRGSRVFSGIMPAPVVQSTPSAQEDFA